MIKRYKIPNYGDIKNETKFAFLPKKFKTDKEKICIWLEKYTNVYKYTRSLRCDRQDGWVYSHSILIEDNENNDETYLVIR